MSELVGHESAWRSWRAATGGARLHHAWLLSGMQGLGKAAFARAAAAELVIGPGQPGIASHPDVIVLEREPAKPDDVKKRDDGKPWNRKRNISVDQVRAMQRRLTTRPTLSMHRAVIVDSADDMEKSAVNALLKSLEEPPVGTMFLLVSHNAGRLLPTVRSRCRTLRFPQLSCAEVTGILADCRPDSSAEERAAAAEAARGSPGRALTYLDRDLAPVAQSLRAILAEGDEDLSRRGALARALGPRPDGESLLAVTQVARAICVDRLGEAPREQRKQLIAAHGALTRLGAQIPTANFDAGLAALEIGGLLAGAAVPKQSR